MRGSTYKSKAEIEGGSAINSNSEGGSFGTKGCSTDFKISCCFCCAEAVTDNFAMAEGSPASCAENGNIQLNNALKERIM